MLGMWAVQPDPAHVVRHLVKKGQSPGRLYDLDRIGTLHQAGHAVWQALRRGIRLRSAPVLGTDAPFEHLHVFGLQGRRDARLRAQHVLISLQPPDALEVSRVGIRWRRAFRRGTRSAQWRRESQSGITAIVQGPGRGRCQRRRSHPQRNDQKKNAAAAAASPRFHEKAYEPMPRQCQATHSFAVDTVSQSNQLTAVRLADESATDQPVIGFVQPCGVEFQINPGVKRERDATEGQH